MTGSWVLRLLGLQAGLRGLLYRFLTGFCVCAILLLAVGSISLSWCTLLLWGMIVVGGGWELTRRKGLFCLKPFRRWWPRSVLEWVTLGTIGLVLGCVLMGVLTPITSWDATVAHLALAKDYAREGRIGLNVGNEYSGYPHLYHTLLTVAYAGSGERGAAWLNFLFAVLALTACAHCAYAAFHNRRGAWLAAGMLATTPIFLDQAQAPSIDLPHTALTLAALGACFEWHNARSAALSAAHRWLWLAAFLAGSACGIRHTGYLVCGLLFLGMVFTPELRRLRFLLPVCGFTVLGAAPWIGRSLWLLGNPVYPFFPNLFGESPILHWKVTGLGIHATTTDSSLLLLLRYPWDLVMHPQFFDGWTKSPGAWVLVFGLPGLFWGGSRALRLGLFSGAGLTGLFFFQRLTRYALPFLSAMFVVASAAACRIPRVQRLVTTLILILFAYGLGLDLLSVHFKVGAVFGLESREHYLARRVERYGAFQWANKHVPADQVLFSFDRRTYYLDGRTFQNDTPLRYLVDKTPADQRAWLRANHIRWLLVPVTFMEESGGYNKSLLPMVNEWRKDAQHFVLRQAMDMARPRTSGTERVEFYEVRYE